MSNKLKGCFSHNTDDWKTPSKMYNYFINKLGCIDCFSFQSVEDEFCKVYFGCSLFVNPPFSKLKYLPDWIQKQYFNGNIIYLLIPSRTDTDYFHRLLEFNPKIYFIKGRLSYNDKGSAPFPSLLLVFDRDKSNMYYSVERCCYE